MRFLCPWIVHGQPRRALSHRRENANAASLGVTPMDLLRARIQGPPPRRLEQFLHRAVLLDEPTAFAAGHRPCFECRRKDAEAFAEKWREVRRLRRPPYAAEMDDTLHAERLLGRTKRLHRRDIGELPDGAIATFDGAAFAIRGDTLLHWTPEGYHARKPRPRRSAIDVLTPPAILEVLSAGYEPRWHASAKD
jgi:hypothetical protein